MILKRGIPEAGPVKEFGNRGKTDRISELCVLLFGNPVIKGAIAEEHRK